MMTNHGNRLTQGQFSFLPDLTDEQILAQIRYALKNEWAVSIEYTDDPHPRNTYWEMHRQPLFDLKDPLAILIEINACRATFPDQYVRVNAFDSTRGWETIRLSFLVQRPADEPGFRLERVEAEGRTIRYALRAYALDRPAGRRYTAAPARGRQP